MSVVSIPALRAFNLMSSECARRLLRVPPSLHRVTSHSGNQHQELSGCDKNFSDRILASGMVEAPQDISGLLAAWGEGNEKALSDLMSMVYPELRRIARQHLYRRGTENTLESAAVANEAYLKLIRARGIRCENRAHFFALCAQMIRHILVDHARNRQYAKRGGDALHVPLAEALPGKQAQGVEVLALDEAMASLAKMDPRKARVVELL